LYQRMVTEKKDQIRTEIANKVFMDIGNKKVLTEKTEYGIKEG